jgi:hypothetical protein
MDNIRPSHKDYIRNSSKKVIDTVNCNGRYVNVTTIRNKIISASIALIALISFGIIVLL